MHFFRKIVDTLLGLRLSLSWGLAPNPAAASPQNQLELRPKPWASPQTPAPAGFGALTQTLLGTCPKPHWGFAPERVFRQ